MLDRLTILNNCTHSAIVSRDFCGNAVLRPLACWAREKLSPLSHPYTQFTPLQETTKLSCLCRVWRGGANWTIAINVLRLHICCGDSLQLSRIQFTPPRQTRQTGLFCRVWPGGVNLSLVTPLLACYHGKVMPRWTRLRNLLKFFAAMWANVQTTAANVKELTKRFNLNNAEGQRAKREADALVPIWYRIPAYTVIISDNRSLGKLHDASLYSCFNILPLDYAKWHELDGFLNKGLQ